MYMPKVKVCGLTRAEDVCAAERLGVDYFGIILYPKSPRCVGDDTLEALLNVIPQGRRVMVDVAPDDNVLEARAKLGFDFFQIHFDAEETPVERIAGWSKIVGVSRLWLAPRIRPEDHLPEHLLEYAYTFVLDAYKAGEFGGTGQTGEWARFAQFRLAHTDKRLALAGGIGPSNVIAALSATGAEIVDLNSGVESAPGIKDVTKLTAVMNALHSLV